MPRGIPIYNPDRLTLDDLLGMSAPTMTRALKGMSPVHKNELLIECEQRIRGAVTSATAVGQECADSRGITRYPAPYTLVKKYSYLYTCIAGWQTKKDLEEREAEFYARQGEIHDRE